MRPGYAAATIATAVLGALATTTACQSPDPSTASDSPTASDRSTRPTVATRSSAAATPTPTETAIPDPPLPSPPATTAGPLTEDNLPAARRVGPTFTPYVEPDAPEEGFVSNGQPVRQRDPNEVALSLVPLGCPGLDRLPPLPVPRLALEQTYRSPQDVAAVALVLHYDTGADAAALLDNLAAMLSHCTAPASTAKLTTPRLVAEVRRPDPATLFDTRAETGPDAAPTRWDETIVRAERRVGLVIIERAPEAPVADQPAIAADLRTLVTR